MRGAKFAGKQQVNFCCVTVHQRLKCEREVYRAAGCPCRTQLKRYALISLIAILQQLFPSFTKIQVCSAQCSPFVANKRVRKLLRIYSLIPYPCMLQAIAGIIITSYLCYEYIRYVPFQTFWVNGLQVGKGGMLFPMGRLPASSSTWPLWP